MPKTFLGLRTSALIEIALFLSAAVLLDAFFFEGNRFMSVSPHPFWIIVLLVTVQYGTGEGLAAALLSTLFFYAGNIPAQKLTESFFTYRMKLLLPPFFWTLAALILGEIRNKIAGERDTYKHELDESTHREETIANAYMHLQKVKDSLEIRLATQTRTAVSAYKSVKHLESLNPGQVLLGLGDVIQGVIAPKKFSVYALGLNGLEAATYHGWEETDNFTRRFLPDTKMYEAIAAKQKLLSLNNPEDAIILENEGVLAAPLINPDSGQVIGMLKLEEMNFKDLTFSTLETIRNLTDWIGLAYAKAAEYKRAAKEAIYCDLGLYSYPFYEIQKSLLLLLAKEGNTPLSEISIELSGKGKEHQILQRDHALLPYLKEKLPKTALLCSGKRAGFEFLILLPQKSEKETENICLQALEHLAQRDRDEETGRCRLKALSLYKPVATETLHEWTAHKNKQQ